MTRRAMLIGIGLLAAGAAGCGGTPPQKADPVDVQGVVTGADGKPVKGVTLVLYPTSAMQNQGGFELPADGKFSGKLIPGKYTFGFEGKPAAMKALPVSYHSNDAAHTVEVPAAGGSLDIKVGGS